MWNGTGLFRFYRDKWEKKDNMMAKRTIRTRFGFLVMTFSVISAMSHVSSGMQNSNTRATQSRQERASAAANSFIQNFHRTRDFGLAFDAVKSEPHLRRFAMSKLFKATGLDASIADHLDDATRERLYIALMNVHFLASAYFASLPSAVDCPNSPEPNLPEDVEAALKKSRFAEPLANDKNATGGFIKTSADLHEYLALQEELATMFRSHLSADVFDSPTYIKTIAARDRKRSTEVMALKGYENGAIPSDVEIFLVPRA